MTGTGYTPERAADHEERVQMIASLLTQRGYRPEVLAMHGNRPDIKIRDRDGRVAFVDVKTRQGRNGNFSIKLGALEEFARITYFMRSRVYVVWGDNHVDTVDSLSARIYEGPRRPTGNGSNTDWLLVHPGGTPFNDFFSELAA